MGTAIDLLDVIARFERELRHGVPPERHSFILSILTRWQTDPDLTSESRHRSAELLARFSRPA